MLPIDALTKHFVQTYPHHFLQFTFQRDDIQLVEILPTEQTTVETRHLDTLLQVRIDGQPSLVHYEFQTADSTPPMPRRMVSYIGRLIGQYGLPVYAHVIYLRPDAGKNDPGSYIQEHPLYPIRIHYAVLRLGRPPRRNRPRWPLIRLTARSHADAAATGHEPRPMADRVHGHDARASARLTSQGQHGVGIGFLQQLDV